jgi:hypothetical protein
VISIIIALCFATSALGAERCLAISESPQSAKATLSGVLQHQWFWGPPNFGEDPKTDAHYQDFVLRLDHPLVLRDSPVLHGNPKLLRAIQIRTEFDKPIREVLRRLVGKHIETSGNLLSAVLPSDNTPVVQWPTEAHLSRMRAPALCVRDV